MNNPTVQITEKFFESCRTRPTPTPLTTSAGAYACNCLVAQKIKEKTDLITQLGPDREWWVGLCGVVVNGYDSDGVSGVKTLVKLSEGARKAVQVYDKAYMAGERAWAIYNLEGPKRFKLFAEETK